MLSLHQARRAIRREMLVVLDELAGLDGDAWGRPTRCQGWSVADLVAHLIWGQRLETQGVAAVAAGRTVTISGPDSELCLFVLGRRGLDDLTVDGDPALAARWKEIVPGP